MEVLKIHGENELSSASMVFVITGSHVLYLLRITFLSHAMLTDQHKYPFETIERADVPMYTGDCPFLQRLWIDRSYTFKIGWPICPPAVGSNSKAARSENM